MKRYVSITTPTPFWQSLEGPLLKALDCLRQVKVSYPDLDLSHVTIDVQAQPSIQPVQFESTGELFTDDAPVDDPHGDEDTAPIVDSAGHHETHVVEEENAPVQH